MDSLRRITGRSLPRLDGIGKVTGKTAYTSDMTLPGMLHGILVRSTETHAAIQRIDPSLALAMPGVRAVLTADDIPDTRYGPAVKDMPALARGRVRYVGEPVAAIAATSPEIAAAARDAVRIVYEPLRPACTPAEALAEDAPQLHPGWASYRALPVLARDGNAASRSRIRHGDLDAGFAAAHRIYEHTFTTQIVHAGYTEPRIAVADWDASGRLTVWSNTQLPFDIQTVLGEILDLSAGRIRVIVPPTGGGFGGKLRIALEPHAALLARHTGRPVRVISSMEEELTAAHPRQPATIVLRTGVTREGRITARHGRVMVDCGAYAGSGPGVGAIALQVLAGPYAVPHSDLESVAVYTNKVPTGSFRAPSGPMANFAVESQIDLIADDLGIDPLEMRLRNLVKEGDLGPSGEKLVSVSIEECLRKAADAIGWSDRRPGRNRAKGLACGWWMTTGGSAGAYLRLDPSGTVTLVSGAVELGTGALTGAAQILADELGVDLADVVIGPVDTQASPYDYGAQGSRTMFAVGNACRAAAGQLRERIFSIAGPVLDASPEAMSLRGGCVVAGNKTLALGEVARLAQATGGGLIAHGTTVALPTPYDPARVSNHPLPAWNTPSYHAHAVDLSVDEGTGEITIHRYVVAQDVGFAVNPRLIEGQIQGGVAQGLGQALSEEIVIEGGRVLNPNLTDYKMPTALDVPPVECILVEKASADGPLGAKGVGEPPCIEPPAAIANAVRAATGIHVPSLPITAEKIALRLADEREGASA